MASSETVEVVTDPKIEAALATIPCPSCGKFTLHMEMRTGPIKVKPVGTFSLAGNQMKLTGTFEAQAFLKCAECEFEKKGHRE